MPNNRTTAESPTVKTATEVRGARIVRRGAILRVLMISLVLAVLALIVGYFIVS